MMMHGLANPKCVYIVYSNTKCLVSQKQHEENPLLYCHGNTEQRHVGQQQTADMYYCVYMATVVTQTCHNVNSM